MEAREAIILTTDAKELLDWLAAHERGGRSKHLARNLRWTKNGAGMQEHQWHKVTQHNTWDAYRVERAAETLIRLGLAQAIHSTSGTRYKAERP